MLGIGKLVRRSLEREALLVSDPPRGRRAMIWPTLLLVAVLAWTIVARSWQPGGALELLADLALAVLAGMAITTAIRTKTAYRNGWLAGRSQMVAALSEAMRRGLSPEDWLEGELQRDAAVLGVELRPIREEDDPENGA